MYNHAYALIGLGMVHNLCGLITVSYTHLRAHETVLYTELMFH